MKKSLRVRCWITIDGEKFFGPGPAELLNGVSKTGSIAKAAKSMGMSYKKAWELINQLNDKGQKPFVILSKGGKKGGGAELTPSAKKVLAAYSKLDKQLDSLVERHKGILKLV